MGLHFLGEDPVDHTGRVNQLHTKQPIHQDNHRVLAVAEEIVEGLEEKDLLLLSPDEVANDRGESEEEIRREWNTKNGVGMNL